MRKPSLDTSSEQSLQFAKSCIRKCTQDHPDCGDGSEEPLPTRILCIGTVENPTVYLRDTATESSRYVCLSHCWGNRAQDSTMLQATTENILEFKKNIPWSELPKTFRDAICFVRLLGIGYIWIDSMCIIQDDPADCAREVGQMASIYSNAFLTIAATSASGPHEGLFSTTTQTSVAQILPGGALNAEFSGYGPVYAHPKIHHTWEEPVNFPLLKRGWVLQERMLSRRVLHFTKKELMWECLSASGCECRSASHVGHRHKKDFISIERIRSQLSDWGDIVRVYSSLRLTLDADTLPALSGLASVWKNAFQDRYLAGLWRHRLLYGLLW
ncbi:HET-domain-containing protein, partial [Periconia macrospinosa]